jgi:hypothetical protein
MVLKGYRLWVMGQLNSTCRAPPRVQAPDEDGAVAVVAPLHVALQVAFERQTLKPVFRLMGFRLWI